jgi:hypothetical protein
VHPLLRFYTGKRVVIEDVRLGTLLWGLRVLLLWFYMNDLINNQGHLDVTDVSAGKANFWANVGNLYSEQGLMRKPFQSNGGYCNQQHWALPAECKTSSTNSDTCYTGQVGGSTTCDGIFCEMDWQCVASDFSQMNIKGEQMMSFVTANKDYKKTTGNCADITSAVCTSRGEKFQKNDNGYQCACVKLENQFLLGAEHMTLNFQHMFTPSAKSGIKPDKHNVCDAKHVRMSLWKSADDGSVTLVKKFPLGEPAKFPVSKWLEMVGVNSLEARNVAADMGGWQTTSSTNSVRGADGQYRYREKQFVGEETYRMTGVGIGLDFVWGGDMREETGFVYASPAGASCSDVQLHVKARLIPGWQSLGSEVHYSDQTIAAAPYKNTNDYPIRQTANTAATGFFKPSFKTTTYHDRYKRGVKFEFTYKGKLGHFDAMAFFTRLSSLIVFLGVAEGIVSLLAFSLMGYKSKVYRRGRDDVMHVEREHAKIAVTTLSAASTFKSLVGKDSTMLHLSEIAGYLESFSGISKEDAHKLATRVVEEGDLDRDGGLSLEEFTNLLTEESGMLHQCIEHLDWKDPAVTEFNAGQMFGFKNSAKAPANVAQASLGSSNPGAPGRVQAMNAHGMLQLHAVVPPGMAPGQGFKVGVPDGRIMQVIVPPGHAPGSTFTFCVPPSAAGPMAQAPNRIVVQPGRAAPAGGGAPLNSGALTTALQQQQQQQVVA